MSNEAGENNEDQSVQVNLLSQYIRDLSFENTGIGVSGEFQNRKAPQVSVSIELQAKRHSVDKIESSIKIGAKAQSVDKQVLFIIELVYCGIFLIRNISEEMLQPYCLIECPRLLFPFARRIIADTTRDGGFLPLLLDPIDFNELYKQRVSTNTTLQSSTIQ